MSLKCHRPTALVLAPGQAMGNQRRPANCSSAAYVIRPLGFPQTVTPPTQLRFGRLCARPGVRTVVFTQSGATLEALPTTPLLQYGSGKQDAKAHGAACGGPAHSRLRARGGVVGAVSEHSVHDSVLTSTPGDGRGYRPCTAWPTLIPRRVARGLGGGLECIRSAGRRGWKLWARRVAWATMATAQ